MGTAGRLQTDLSGVGNLMPVIDGVTVDFRLSPRVMTIPAPVTSVTVQDVYDTARHLEGRWANLGYPILVSVSGGEALPRGISVSHTVTLLDLQLAFEARTGPYIQRCTVSGANLVVDSGISPIRCTAFTSVETRAEALENPMPVADNVRVQYDALAREVTYMENREISAPVRPPRFIVIHAPVGDTIALFYANSHFEGSMTEELFPAFRAVKIVNTFRVPDDVLHRDLLYRRRGTRGEEESLIPVVIEEEFSWPLEDGVAAKVFHICR